MHVPARLQELRVYAVNSFHGQAHHGLVTYLTGQVLVIHPNDMKMRLTTMDRYVRRRRGIAKRFFKSADTCPPMERLKNVARRKNGDRSDDRRFHLCADSIPQSAILLTTMMKIASVNVGIPRV